MADSLALTKAEAGVTVRDGFDGIEQYKSAETAQSAVAARAEAEIKARYIMAMQRPRNTERFRQMLLQECKRLGFAEKVEYAKPVGGKDDKGKSKVVRGPSIRLIEMAIRCFTNIASESPVIYEDAELRIVRAQMVDLETNTIWSQDVVIPKRVERKGYDGKPPAGRVVLSHRLNSEKEATYLVVATDDEIAIKQAALISKAQRNNGTRILPSDIIEEALDVARTIVHQRIKDDPKAAMRKIGDGFLALNVAITDLESYLGKKVDLASPAEIDELRLLYRAIKDGDVTWEGAMALRDIQGTKDAQQEAAAKKLAELRAAEDAKKKNEAAAPAAAPSQASQTVVDAQAEGDVAADPLVEVHAFVSTLGMARINAQCKEMGYEHPEQVPAGMMPALIDRLKKLQASPTNTTEKPKLNLGGRK